MRETWCLPIFMGQLHAWFKKPTDLDLHCLPLSMWSYINNLDQVIWLAENWVGMDPLPGSWRCRHGRSHTRSPGMSIIRVDSRELPLSAIPLCLTVSCFHVILGLLGPCFPSTLFSLENLWYFFLFFQENNIWLFYANCLHWRQFAWYFQSCFLEKIRKIFQYVVCWKFYSDC